MLMASKCFIRPDGDPHFFHKLSVQALYGIFPGLQFAAGEFPQPCLRFARFPPGDQQLSFFIMYNRRRYFNHRFLLLCTGTPL
ncbi:hypothetical protein D3C86_2088350 [compost metagenome]